MVRCSSISWSKGCRLCASGQASMLLLALPLLQELKPGGTSAKPAVLPASTRKSVAKPSIQRSKCAQQVVRCSGKTPAPALAMTMRTAPGV